MTIEQKREYMERYYVGKQKIMKLYEINDQYIETMISAKAIQYSDMPKAHNKTDLSDIMVRMEDNWERIYAQKKENEKAKQEIFNAIYTLTNEVEIKVMILRYIRLKGWKEIEYIVPNARMVNSRALRKVKIGKGVII